MTTFPYRGNLDWLEANTILLAKHGSHAYGTATPESDLDIKGIAVPPSKYFLGYLERFEQATQNEPDLVIFDIRKFFSLAADCNPNIIEVLWVADEDILRTTLFGDRIREHRDLFLSKKARHTFSGYAMSQLKRIKGHYKWSKDPPKAPPVRGDYGLPERTVVPADQLAIAQSMIQKKLDSWEFRELEDVDEATRIGIVNSMAEVLAELNLTANEKFRAAGRSLGLSDDFMAVLEQERRYNTAAKEWEAYRNWQKNRNPARAALEAKYGYDCKHAGHLVRLLKMCREILETGKVLVKRPDREELLAIRNGAWSYEQVLEWAEQQDRDMEAAYKVSTLPHGPDRKALDTLCQSIVQDFFNQKGW